MYLEMYVIYKLLCLIKSNLYYVWLLNENNLYNHPLLISQVSIWFIWKKHRVYVFSDKTKLYGHYSRDISFVAIAFACVSGRWVQEERIESKKKRKE